MDNELFDMTSGKWELCEGGVINFPGTSCCAHIDEDDAEWIVHAHKEWPGMVFEINRLRVALAQACDTMECLIVGIHDDSAISIARSHRRRFLAGK